MNDASIDPSDAARVSLSGESDVWTLELAGRWTTRRITAVDSQLRLLEVPANSQVAIDCSQIEAFDTAGAWLIDRTERGLNARGLKVSIENLSPEQAQLLVTVKSSDTLFPETPEAPNSFVAVVERVGKATYQICGEGRDLVNFLGHSVVVLGRSIAHPGKVRLTPLVHHIEQAGLNAIPIVGLISFLIGVVLAFQGAEQLAKFGAQIFTVNIVAQGVLREMGVLLTAIMLAGRSGSAFTAQIGTMKVREEVDAMQTIGLDPMEILVLPRLWALVIVLPLLTFFANMMGLLGGAIMATATLDVTFFQFARQLSGAITMWTFWIGIIKAPIFGFIIGLVGCYEGMRVSGSAESVGRMTTRSVVESIFLVIVLDAMFSVLFATIGI